MYKYLIFVTFGILLYLFLNTSNHGFSIGGSGEFDVVLKSNPNESLDTPSPIFYGANPGQATRHTDDERQNIQDYIQSLDNSELYEVRDIAERREELRDILYEEYREMGNPLPNRGDVVEIYTPDALQILTNEGIRAHELVFDIPDDLQNTDIGIVENIETLDEEEIQILFRGPTRIEQMQMATLRMYRPSAPQWRTDDDYNLNLVLTNLILAYATMNLGTADQPGSPLRIIPEDLLIQIITEIGNFARQIGVNRTYRVPVYRLTTYNSPLNILTEREIQIRSFWERIRMCASSSRLSRN
jgi:hypothetical protein